MDQKLPNPTKPKTQLTDVPGACLITNPETGQNECILVTKAECRKLKGTFLGGPCGGI